MRTNTTVLSLVYAAIVAIMGGCRSTHSDSVITFWAMGNEGENVLKLLPEFQRRHPDIRVRVQSIPWTAAHEKLLTAYAGGSTPDVCQLGNTWIPEFSMLKAIDDLSPWVERSSVINEENYFPGIWATNVIDSAVYGIPWYVDTRVLYYRTDILARAGYSRAPRTWDELFDVSKRITQLSPGEEKYAILLPTNEWAPFVIFGLQAGSPLLRDGNQYGAFSGEEFRRAFSFAMSFYENKLAPVGVTQVTSVYQGIAEGFFAMYSTGPWNIGEFKRRLPADVQDKWMTAPMPGPDSLRPGVSLAGGSSLVMFRNSQHKEAVWKLIEFLSGVDQQVTFYNITGNLPAVREAWKDTSFTSSPYIQAFYTQFEHVVPTPKVPEWEQIAMKVQQYAEVASMKRSSVEDALRALDRDVNIILEKHRWMLSRR